MHQSHDPNRFPLDDLGRGIDACACSIPKGVADNLSQMTHQEVVALELVVLDAKDSAVVVNSDEEISALSVQERRDGLQERVSHHSLVHLAFSHVPSQAGFEFQGGRLRLLEQLLSLAVGPQVLVEQ